ncbi:MAG: EI24 domain-containing protein [Rhodospirillales bacterium]|nr:EI24 domain-containing protein [Rhodospirillales bacterium]
MIKAFSRAIRQLTDPALRRVFIVGLVGSIVIFGALWGAVAYFLASGDFFAYSIFGFEFSLNFVTNILGNMAVAILSWLLFPAVITIIVSLFLEDVAEAVEGRHYPGLGAPRKQAIAEIVWITVKFAGLSIILNILALPIILILIFFPPFNLFVFYGLNGYLLGREYFELVAHRRLDPARAHLVRVSFRGHTFIAGVIIAVLMTVPVVNLVAPIIATAAMVHLVQGWRERLEPARES